MFWLEHHKITTFPEPMSLPFRIPASPRSRRCGVAFPRSPLLSFYIPITPLSGVAFPRLPSLFLRIPVTPLTWRCLPYVDIGLLTHPRYTPGRRRSPYACPVLPLPGVTFLKSASLSFSLRHKFWNDSIFPLTR